MKLSIRRVIDVIEKWECKMFNKLEFWRNKKNIIKKLKLPKKVKILCLSTYIHKMKKNEKSLVVKLKFMLEEKLLRYNN